MTDDEVIKKISKELSAPEPEVALIVKKAFAGGEISNSLEEWAKKRFLPNIVFIDDIGYSQMCIDALKILRTTAPTDYGGSRQRDLGQLWADMTRGYLGELALSLFLKKNWGIEMTLGHEKGELSKYLPTDMEAIRKPNEKKRKPRIKVGIKTTKWNGIWLDLPGSQFDHSDVHVLIKVGTGRDHLFAFFKKISVFKDKIFKVGKDIGFLSEKEAELLYASLPNFRPVPAYVCGFILKSEKYKELSYGGKLGRKNYEINSWNGPINPEDLDEIKRKESVPGKIRFKGIDKFSHDKGYLFNTGNLLWTRRDWDLVISKL